MTRNPFHRLIAAAALLFALAPAATAFAQTAALSITAAPATPQPGDTVTLGITSASLDLSAANITWYADGAPFTEGIGAVSATATARNDGQPTVIRALAKAADGTSAEASYTITPSRIDLVVEPLSYVPPFYKGGAIFPVQGTARIIAVPDVVENGVRADPANLVYAWQKDGVALPGNSGRGMDTLAVSGSVPISDITMTVTVTDQSGAAIGSASTILSASNPKILFYEDNPLYGVLFNQAVGQSYYLGQRQGVTFAAEPYFFSTAAAAAPSLGYAWSVNGDGVPASGAPNELILQQATQNLQGTAAVSLSLKSLSDIFQYATGGFSVTFGI